MCQLTKLSFGELSINLSCKTQTTYFQQKSINFIEISSSIFSSRPKAFSPALLPNLHPPQKKIKRPPHLPFSHFLLSAFHFAKGFSNPTFGGRKPTALVFAWGQHCGSTPIQRVEMPRPGDRAISSGRYPVSVFKV